MNNKEKACKKCGEVKGFEEFKIERRNKDGTGNTCKSCSSKIRKEYHEKTKEQTRDMRNKKNRKWRELNREKIKQTSKMYRQRELEKRRSYHNKYRKENGSGVRANSTLSYHVRVKNIIKPTKCENCFNIHNSNFIVGHHEDYNYPLNVIWLCNICHINYHQGISEKAFDIKSKVKLLYKEKYPQKRKDNCCNR